MGCASSAEAHDHPDNATTLRPRPSTLRRGASDDTGSDGSETRRIRVMRKSSSRRLQRYTTNDKASDVDDDLSSRGTPRGGDRGSARGSARGSTAGVSVHDTLLNSDAGPSHMLSTNRSSMRSLGVSPRLPQAQGFGRTLQIAQSRLVDRRVSVGRFADEPTDAEVAARQAATAAKARMVHGIDGSVEEVTERQRRQNAKMAAAMLGPDGTQRVRQWATDVYYSNHELETPRIDSSGGSGSPIHSAAHPPQYVAPQVCTFLDGEGEEVSVEDDDGCDCSAVPMGASSPSSQRFSRTRNAFVGGALTQDDEVDNLMLSPGPGSFAGQPGGGTTLNGTTNNHTMSTTAPGSFTKGSASPSNGAGRPRLTEDALKRLLLATNSKK